MISNPNVMAETTVINAVKKSEARFLGDHGQSRVVLPNYESNEKHYSIEKKLSFWLFPWSPVHLILIHGVWKEIFPRFLSLPYSLSTEKNNSYSYIPSCDAICHYIKTPPSQESSNVNRRFLPLPTFIKVSIFSTHQI